MWIEGGVEGGWREVWIEGGVEGGVGRRRCGGRNGMRVEGGVD